VGRTPHLARAFLGLAAMAAVAGVISLPAEAQSPPPAATSVSVGPSVEMPIDPRVFIIRATGGQMRRVTPRGMFGFDPEWNPRTGALVAVTEQGMVELGLGRGGPTKGQPVWRRRATLTSEMGWSPSFSPDGSEIALVTGGRPDVWVLTRRTGRIRQVTTDWDAEGFVDWSPGGTEIAAVRFGQILVLDRSGVVTRAITAADQTCMLPAWSPRGRRIAFTCLFAEAGIAVADRFGGNVRRVTTSDVQAAYPAWSRDGKRLAFAKFVDGSWDLFVRELRSGRERRLTRTPYDEVDPVWSPDGSWLAFTSNERPIR
jgi:Tol biopolymer transport system component